MDEKKTFEMDKKKWIVLAVAILVLILLLLLLLRACGGTKGDDNNTDDGGATVASTTDTTVSTTAAVNEEIGYDEALASTWYLEDRAMVLNEEGFGSLYYGDKDGGEIQWHTAGNRLTLTIAEQTFVVTYAVSDDNLTLTYDDGKVETWIR